MTKKNNVANINQSVQAAAAAAKKKEEKPKTINLPNTFNARIKSLAVQGDLFAQQAQTINAQLQTISEAIRASAFEAMIELGIGKEYNLVKKQDSDDYIFQLTEEKENK